MIIVQQAGLLASLQDAGRRGHRRLGIPWAGTLAPHWMQAANTLVGNSPDHVVIECHEGGLILEAVDDSATAAVVGDVSLSIRASAGERDVPGWQRLTLAPGERLTVQRTGCWRLAIVAIQGLQVPRWLGSSATYARAGLGGLEGRNLQAGDRLPTAAPVQAADAPAVAMSAFGTPATDADGTLIVRAVPGPQDDHFSSAALELFFESPWHVSSDADRMGVRLEGQALTHRDPGSRDIISDAILPGSVQVPGAGLPIVMLADAHTAGGYPKIATVLSTDLPALGLARPGSRLRFERVSADEACEHARNDHHRWDRALKRLTPVDAGATIDLERLARCNLISGVTDGAHEP